MDWLPTRMMPGHAVIVIWLFKDTKKPHAWVSATRGEGRIAAARDCDWSCILSRIQTELGQISWLAFFGQPSNPVQMNRALAGNKFVDFYLLKRNRIVGKCFGKRGILPDLL